MLTTSFANMRNFAAKLGTERDYKVLVQGRAAQEAVALRVRRG